MGTPSCLPLFSASVTSHYFWQGCVSITQLLPLGNYNITGTDLECSLEKKKPQLIEAAYTAWAAYAKGEWLARTKHIYCQQEVSYCSWERGKSTESI